MGASGVAPNRSAQDQNQVHQLAIQGMSCASCVGRVERALKAVPGVTRSFAYCAAKIGADTLLARIVRMVEEAQGGEAAHSGAGRHGDSLLHSSGYGPRRLSRF